jgi:Leucine-rich repeat (LRR) protein
MRRSIAIATAMLVIMGCWSIAFRSSTVYAQGRKNGKSAKKTLSVSPTSGSVQKGGVSVPVPEVKQGVLLDSAQLMIQFTFTSLEEALRRPDKVYKLRLDETNMSVLPPTIGNLVNLQELSLDRNQLVTLPPEIGKLTNLQVLVLDKNKLQRLPREMMSLRNLQKLYLNNYNLKDESDIAPEDEPGEELRALWIAIDSLLHLETLGLGENKFKTFPAAILRAKSLRCLYLNNNSLTEIHPGIGTLSSLEQLDLSNNQLKVLPSEMGKLRKLQVLDVRLNNLAKLPPEIGGCMSLVDLDLGFNTLKELPDEIGDLKNLEKINVSNNRLTTIPVTVEKWERMKRLKMTDNPIKDEAEIAAKVRKLQNRKTIIERDIKR